MKAQELRIGNLIKTCKNSPMPNQEFTIQEVGRDCITIVGQDKQLLIYFEPIPLTKEWLLKFGFEWDLKRCTYSLDNFHLTRWSDNKYLIGHDADESQINIQEVELNHVHQLQNLVHALTGTDL